MVLAQLRKTPIVQVVCEKTGVARSSFYRWKTEDAKFAEEADKAVEEGRGMINDLAESQLVSSIQGKNMTAVIFWLRSHHPSYKQKMELSGEIKKIEESLNPEQEETVKQALRLSSIITEENIRKIKEIQNHGEKRSDA